MKPTPGFIILLLLLHVGPLVAQEVEEEKEKFHKLSVYALFVQPGIYVQHNLWGVVEDFKIIVPQSTLLNNDFSGYSERHGAEVASNPFFSMMVGFKFSNKQKSLVRANPIVRMGLTYFSGMDYTTTLYKRESKTFDTLVSSQVGQTIYLDSVSTSFYDMKYSSGQVRIDISILFVTDPYARFSLFTGVGFTAGISVNAQTEISYRASKHIETTVDDNSTVSQLLPAEDRYESEKFHNKANKDISVFIPIGVDFRIGQIKKFWRRAHVFFEMRPGANFMFIPELRTIKSAGVQNSLGFKITLD